MIATVPPIDAAGREAELAAFFEVLSSPVRLRILRALEQAESPVHGLASLVNLRQQAISHHLMIMKYRSLVAWRRDAKSNVYRLTDRGRQAIATMTALSA